MERAGVGAEFNQTSDDQRVTVLRFWWAVDSQTLPDKESILTAQSWVQHRQIVYTNVPEEAWRDAGLEDYDIVPYEPSRSFHSYQISPQ